MTLGSFVGRVLAVREPDDLIPSQQVLAEPLERGRLVAHRMQREFALTQHLAHTVDVLDLWRLACRPLQPHPRRPQLEPLLASSGPRLCPHVSDAARAFQAD